MSIAISDARDIWVMSKIGIMSIVVIQHLRVNPRKFGTVDFGLVLQYF